MNFETFINLSYNGCSSQFFDWNQSNGNNENVRRICYIRYTMMGNIRKWTGGIKMKKKKNKPNYCEKRAKIHHLLKSILSKCCSRPCLWVHEFYNIRNWCPKYHKQKTNGQPFRYENNNICMYFVTWKQRPETGRAGQGRGRFFSFINHTRHSIPVLFCSKPFICTWNFQMGTLLFFNLQHLSLNIVNVFTNLFSIRSLFLLFLILFHFFSICSYAKIFEALSNYFTSTNNKHKYVV